MKIKNQLTITIAIFIILIIVISLSIFYTEQQLTILSNDLVITGNIQTGVANLNHAIDFFYLYQQDSQLLAWQSNITALYNNVEAINSTDNQQSQISNKLWTDIQKADSSFNSTVSYIQKTPLNEPTRANPQFQTIYGGLSDALQTLSNDASTLSQSLHSQTLAVVTSNIFLIIALLIAFALFLMISYFIMFRRALKSIAELDKGIKVIATGNFDYSVKTESKDEIGELTNSINEMTIQLKNITTKLKEQERLAAIGQTAGMVGHDLRNPLQALIGQAYLLEGELGTLPESQSKENINESIQVITEQITYMDKIVSDLQAFVRPVKIEKKDISLKELIESVLSAIVIPNNIIVQNQIQYVYHQVKVDPQLLKRVLINLVTNAVQAMPNGGTLTLTAEKASSGETIAVQDTGVGIPDDIKPKIFMPLFTTKPRGQGFGLAVCKRVMEAQGGTINFESQEGKGTKFTITLPLR